MNQIVGLAVASAIRCRRHAYDDIECVRNGVVLNAYFEQLRALSRTNSGSRSTRLRLGLGLGLGHRVFTVTCDVFDQVMS